MAKEQGAEDIVMEKKDIGEVKIASDVVSVIAALAATEVEGVSSMAAITDTTSEAIFTSDVYKRCACYYE